MELWTSYYKTKEALVDRERLVSSLVLGAY
jgi:hypothetical protein